MALKITGIQFLFYLEPLLYNNNNSCNLFRVSKNPH